MSSLTLHFRLNHAVCLQAGVAILAVVLVLWMAPAFIGGSRAISLQQSANSNPEIVISQIYGGGGSSVNGFRNDFIELFNRGAVTISLVGWSLQYAIGNSGAWQKIELSGSIAPGQYYLIQLAPGSLGSKELPAPDARGTIGVDAVAGKVALVKNNQPITNTPNTSCPSSLSQVNIVDFVAYGSLANCFRGSAPAPVAGSASATVRRGDGCTNTNSNNNDFFAAPPNPRNSASPLKPCSGAGTGSADLLITTQTSSAAVPPRGIVSLLIKVFNSGPSPATNVMVTNAVPEGFTDIVIQAGSGQTGLDSIIGNSIAFFPVDVLKPGETLIYAVSARAPAVGGKYVNRAVANSDTFDPATANNTSLTEISVLAGARFEARNVVVAISQSGSCSTSYTVETRITNTGVTPQGNNSGAEFMAGLSPEIVAASCSATKGSCRTSRLPGSSGVQWEGDVAVGETVTITYSMQIVGSPPKQIGFCVEERVNFDSDNDGQNDSTTTVSACDSYNPDCSTTFPEKPSLNPLSPASSQKAGSILIYNLYTSSSADPEGENTRISITNTSSTSSATVHLFFVSADTCEVSDGFLCLTTSETTSFLISDFDPDIRGFLIVMAVDSRIGCPINQNTLIGEEYVRLGSGHAANLGAEAFSAIAGVPCECSENSLLATVLFDGIRYNRVPRSLIANGIPSIPENNSTFLVLNRVGGNLLSRTEAIGDFTGLLFDDQERSVSFAATGGCQFRQLISNTFPRTTPRFSQFVPSGHTGWMKITAAEGVGILGSMIVLNKGNTTNAFNGASNLHKVSFTGSASFTVPIFQPTC
ncbi:MAG TPA: lamin tail domain-containing protein [Blastocatellia bacterium]|nr:lamin tail domain-containing protein [Blastocatellia bacterium]